jgi:hypothetical protein
MRIGRKLPTIASGHEITLRPVDTLKSTAVPSGFVPLDNRTFGFVRNVFIIPHVIQMIWENRMAEGMAAYRGLLGIGVDAGAAVAVHGNQSEVIGDSKVLLPNGSGRDGKGYEALSAGTRFDLAQAMKRMNVQPAQSHNQAIVRPNK